MFFLFFIRFAGEHATGCKDVFTARAAYGADYSARIEVVAEGSHVLFVACAEVYAGYGMIANEVDANRLMPYEVFEGFGMLEVVVERMKHSVLEREASLMREVVLAKHLQHIFYGICFFHGHKAESFVVEWRVHRYGDMNRSFGDEAFEFLHFANRRDGDALRAPGKTPVGGHNLDGLQHGFEVVHRFAHAHKHHIGQAFAFGYAKHLIDNLIGSEIAVKTLAAGHAETAIHFATFLRRDAESGAVVVGDINALHGLAVAGGEEIFGSAIDAALLLAWRFETERIGLLQTGAIDLGDIVHLVETLGTVHIEPFGQLLGSETRHS